MLHLSRLNPDILYIHQDSGLVNVAYFKFDLDELSGELESNRPVPFRLTPNLTELVTSVGVAGIYIYGYLKKGNNIWILKTEKNTHSVGHRLK